VQVSPLASFGRIKLFHSERDGEFGRQLTVPGCRLNGVLVYYNRIKTLVLHFLVRPQRAPLLPSTDPGCGMSTPGYTC
jgi:hypothetical protein